MDFEGQNKDSLEVIKGIKTYGSNPEILDAVYRELKKHEKLVSDYIRRIKDVEDAFNKVKTKEYIKKKVVLSAGEKKLKSTPKTLFDAISKNRQECELHICEGKSAGGQLLAVSDRQKHAILMLRGRPLNTSHRSIKDVVKNQEMLNLINIIGMGVKGHSTTSSVRYGKIIIASDADPDGGLISASLLVTIATHMPFLISMGLVYVAETPFYEQDGKFIYPSDPPEFLNKNKPYKRFKGLGELSESQIKRALITEERRLVKITMDGSSKAKKFLLKDPHTRRELMKNSGLLTGKLDEI